MYKEQYRKQELTPGSKIEQEIKDFHKAERLIPGEEFSISPLSPENPPIQAIEDKSLGLKQSLRGMVELGKSDFLSIIDVNLNNGRYDYKTTALAYLKPGEGASVIAFVDAGEGPVILGKEHQDFADFSRFVSREHVSVAQTEDGIIKLIDLKSTNGTEVFVPRNVRSDSKSVFNTDPMRDHTFWSVKSSDLMDSFGL